MLLPEVQRLMPLKDNLYEDVFWGGQGTVCLCFKSLVKVILGARDQPSCWDPGEVTSLSQC